MICVRVRCCILTIGSSETMLVLFVKNNLKISALCELSPKATSPAKKVDLLCMLILFRSMLCAGIACAFNYLVSYLLQLFAVSDCA